MLAVEGGTAVVTSDNVMYMFGGFVVEGRLGFNVGELLACNLNTFEFFYPKVSGDLPVRRNKHTAVLDDQNRMWVWGGSVWDHTGGSATYASTALYVADLSNRKHVKWTKVETQGLPPSQRRLHAAALRDGVMYIIGGEDYSSKSYLQDVHALDLDTLTWSQPAVKGNAGGGHIRAAAVGLSLKHPSAALARCGEGKSVPATTGELQPKNDRLVTVLEETAAAMGKGPAPELIAAAMGKAVPSMGKAKMDAAAMAIGWLPDTPRKVAASKVLVETRNMWRIKLLANVSNVGLVRLGEDDFPGFGVAGDESDFVEEADGWATGRRREGTRDAFKTETKHADMLAAVVDDGNVDQTAKVGKKPAVVEDGNVDKTAKVGKKHTGHKAKLGKKRQNSQSAETAGMLAELEIQRKYILDAKQGEQVPGAANNVAQVATEADAEIKAEADDAADQVEADKTLGPAEAAAKAEAEAQEDVRTAEAVASRDSLTEANGEGPTMTKPTAAAIKLAVEKGESVDPVKVGESVDSMYASEHAGAVSLSESSAPLEDSESTETMAEAGAAGATVEGSRVNHQDVMQIPMAELGRKETYVDKNGHVKVKKVPGDSAKVLSTPSEYGRAMKEMAFAQLGAAAPMFTPEMAARRTAALGGGDKEEDKSSKKSPSEYHSSISGNFDWMVKKEEKTTEEEKAAAAMSIHDELMKKVKLELAKENFQKDSAEGPEAAPEKEKAEDDAVAGQKAPGDDAHKKPPTKEEILSDVDSEIEREMKNMKKEKEAADAAMAVKVAEDVKAMKVAEDVKAAKAKKESKESSGKHEQPKLGDGPDPGSDDDAETARLAEALVRLSERKKVVEDAIQHRMDQSIVENRKGKLDANLRHEVEVQMRKKGFSDDELDLNIGHEIDAIQAKLDREKKQAAAAELRAKVEREKEERERQERFRREAVAASRVHPQDRTAEQNATMNLFTFDLDQAMAEVARKKQAVEMAIMIQHAHEVERSQAQIREVEEKKSAKVKSMEEEIWADVRKRAAAADVSAMGSDIDGWAAPPPDPEEVRKAKEEAARIKEEARKAREKAERERMRAQKARDEAAAKRQREHPNWDVLTAARKETAGAIEKQIAANEMKAAKDEVQGLVDKQTAIKEGMAMEERKNSFNFAEGLDDGYAQYLAKTQAEEEHQALAEAAVGIHPDDLGAKTSDDGATFGGFTSEAFSAIMGSADAKNSKSTFSSFASFFSPGAKDEKVEEEARQEVDSLHEPALGLHQASEPSALVWPLRTPLKPALTVLGAAVLVATLSVVAAQRLTRVMANATGAVDARRGTSAERIPLVMEEGEFRASPLAPTTEPEGEATWQKAAAARWQHHLT